MDFLRQLFRARNILPWIAFGSLGCTGKSEEPASPSEPEFDDQTLAAVRGLEIFGGNGCVLCHCTNARGDCNLGAPNIQSVPLERIRAQINVGPPIHPLRQPMSDTQLRDLATFLDGLDSTEPLPRQSRLARGYNLYAGVDGCIQCHLSPPEGVNQPLLGPVLTSCPVGDTNCSGRLRSPDQLYFTLIGADAPCHPVQRRPPAQVPCACGDREITTTTAVGLLTDVAPPSQDEDRVQLAYFLSFIAPQPKTLENPCDLGENPDECAFDPSFVHMHEGMTSVFVDPSTLTPIDGTVSCGDAGEPSPVDATDAGDN